MKIDGCIHDGWLSISKFENYVTSDYLYHVLMSGMIQREMTQKASFGGAVQNLNADIVKNLVLPIPPIALQNRIADVLDHFEAICSDLKIGLPAEIEARKKQYEFYRDALLTFAATGDILRAEQSRAEQSRAEQSRAEQSSLLI